MSKAVFLKLLVMLVRPDKRISQSLRPLRVCGALVTSSSSLHGAPFPHTAVGPATCPPNLGAVYWLIAFLPCSLSLLFHDALLLRSVATLTCWTRMEASPLTGSGPTARFQLSLAETQASPCLAWAVDLLDASSPAPGAHFSVMTPSVR